MAVGTVTEEYICRSLIAETKRPIMPFYSPFCTFPARMFLTLVAKRLKVFSMVPSEVVAGKKEIKIAFSRHFIKAFNFLRNEPKLITLFLHNSLSSRKSFAISEQRLLHFVKRMLASIWHRIKKAHCQKKKVCDILGLPSGAFFVFTKFLLHLPRYFVRQGDLGIKSYI